MQARPNTPQNTRIRIEAGLNYGPMAQPVVLLPALLRADVAHLHHPFTVTSRAGFRSR